MSMSWPQGIMAALLVFSMARGMIKHGESDGTVNFWVSLIANALMVGLLYWGGFWK